MSADRLPPEAVRLTTSVNGATLTMDASPEGRAATMGFLDAMCGPPPSPAALARAARVKLIGADAVLREELDALAARRARAR